MAKVKIQGHASGTGILTVTAPNTSTDRTITLPDATGTLATTADVPSSITDNGDATAITIDSDEIVSFSSHVKLVDNGYVVLGAGEDLKMNSDGANGVINAAQGYLALQTGSIERMRVTSDGLTFNGDTAAANALDDYEEGSWTPAFTGHQGSAGSVAHSVQEAFYTKIGRLVTCQFKMTLSNRGSWSGEVRLTGLPFTASETLPAAGSVSLHQVNVPNDASGHDVYVDSTVSYFRFFYTQDFGSRTFVQVDQVTDAARFDGTISYIV